MKIIFTFLLFTFFFISKVSAASLTIYLSKCRSECDTETGLIKVYKGRKLIHKSRSSKTVINNLSEGTYYVRYNSIAEKKRELEVVIAEKEAKVLTLCFDDFEYYKKQAPSAIDVLKVEDRILISYDRKYKRQHETDSIAIIHKQDGYYLNYHGTVRQLNDVEREIIREFEYFLRHFSRKGRSRKKDKYVFQYGNNVLKRKDKTSAWNGFHYLLVDLKLIDSDAC